MEGYSNTGTPGATPSHYSPSAPATYYAPPDHPPPNWQPTSMGYSCAATAGNTTCSAAGPHAAPMPRLLPFALALALSLPAAALAQGGASKPAEQARWRGVRPSQSRLFRSSADAVSVVPRPALVLGAPPPGLARSASSRRWNACLLRWWKWAWSWVMRWCWGRPSDTRSTVYRRGRVRCSSISRSTQEADMESGKPGVLSVCGSLVDARGDTLCRRCLRR